MYHVEDKDQLVTEDFHMPFAGKLDPNNRWVRLSELMPWEKIEEIYLQTMSMETDREAITARKKVEHNSPISGHHLCYCHLRNIAVCKCSSLW